ncbi:uncharacterized protein LOC135109739 [Scylla paramamosain]|uniref:uncharacterized protein LOC135109739 n=1 Tax=Scylla paramamosain TaxID=85552 RepID=UPI003082A3CE
MLGCFVFVTVTWAAVSEVFVHNHVAGVEYGKGSREVTIFILFELLFYNMSTFVCLCGLRSNDRWRWEEEGGGRAAGCLPAVFRAALVSLALYAILTSFLLPCIEHRQVAPKRHEYISFSLHRTPSSSTKEARVHKVRSGSSDTMAKQRPCGGGGRGRRQRACQVYHQAGSLELP